MSLDYLWLLTPLLIPAYLAVGVVVVAAINFIKRELTDSYALGLCVALWPLMVAAEVVMVPLGYFFRWTDRTLVWLGDKTKFGLPRPAPAEDDEYEEDDTELEEAVYRVSAR